MKGPCARCTHSHWRHAYDSNDPREYWQKPAICIECSCPEFLHWIDPLELWRTRVGTRCHIRIRRGNWAMYFTEGPLKGSHLLVLDANTDAYFPLFRIKNNALHNRDSIQRVYCQPSHSEYDKTGNLATEPEHPTGSGA